MRESGFFLPLSSWVGLTRCPRLPASRRNRSSAMRPALRIIPLSCGVAFASRAIHASWSASAISLKRAPKTSAGVTVRRSIESSSLAAPRKARTAYARWSIVPSDMGSVRRRSGIPPFRCSVGEQVSKFQTHRIVSSHSGSIAWCRMIRRSPSSPVTFTLLSGKPRRCEPLSTSPARYPAPTCFPIMLKAISIPRRTVPLPCWT